MDILVIKQTSLGDVLHSTGHVRSIKQHYPDSRLTVMTATTSADIYRHNPWVDDLILVDRYGFKANWWRRPLWAFGEMWRAIKDVRRREYEVAFDLQGLAKTVVFLYAARARRKYAKGRWWGVVGYRNRDVHAIEEMDGVLREAGIRVENTAMELVPGDDAVKAVNSLVSDINPGRKPVLLISPFSRWPSKDWPLTNYFRLAEEIADEYLPLITGSGDKKAEIDAALAETPDCPAINLAGRLSLPEFAALVGIARLMVTGDSFPMHVGGAMSIPVIALFGPTDENKVGPMGSSDRVIRAPDCQRCDRANCERQCLSRIAVETVRDAVRSFRV